MATTVHITHIEDTWANLVAGADHGQVMIANDVTADLPYDEFIWVDDSGDKFYVAAAQKYWSVAGGSWTYLNAEFEDIDANGDIYASEYVYHLGDTDTYIRFQPDLISFFAGNVDLLELIEDTQDVVFVNYAQADVDFRVDWDGGTSLFARGSDGIVAIGTASPQTWKTATYEAVMHIGDYSAISQNGLSETNFTSNAYFDVTDSRWEYIGTDYAHRIMMGSTDNFVFYTAAVGSAGDAITWLDVFRIEGNTSAGAIVFNECGGPYDFRIEADAMTNAFFLDASLDSGLGRIGMGTGSPDRPLHVERDTATTNAVQYLLRLTETCSGTVADGFGVGMEFELENSTQSTNHVAARISAVWEDESDIDSDLIIEVNNGGSITEVCRVTSRGTINFASMPTSAVGLSSGDLWYDASNGYVTQA